VKQCQPGDEVFLHPPLRFIVLPLPLLIFVEAAAARAMK
jgi:hypothetical protein